MVFAEVKLVLLSTAVGPLRNFNVCFAFEFSRGGAFAFTCIGTLACGTALVVGHDLRGKGAPGQASALRFGGRRVRRLPSGARSLGPSTNSLRSLRSLRSDRCRQVSLRGTLRAQAKSPALLSAEEARCHLPGRAFAATLLMFGGRANTVPARGGRQPAGAISGAARSAGLAARARSVPRRLTSRRLFEGSERSERSEFGEGPQDRRSEPGHKQSSGLFVPGERPGHWPGPQCSRRTRRPPPHEPLPAAAQREPRQPEPRDRTFAKDRNGPRTGAAAKAVF